MTPRLNQRLRLGCGEALSPMTRAPVRREPPPVPSSRPGARHMPRLLNGVLSQR